MVQELARDNDTNPVLQAPQVGSDSRGKQNIAQTLGRIAERSMSQATDYASAASKENLLQTHSMIQDVEANSRLEIFKSPNHAAAIAQNADEAITKIKGGASLNRSDRSSLDSMSKTTLRNLNLTAAEKEISLNREQAKYATLASFGNTLQTVKQQIFSNPEQADKLIEDQYEALQGQVTAGILTPVEAANLHKQFTSQLEIAQVMAQGLRDGTLTASDASALHEMDSAHIPMSNAGLPIDHHTAMNADHHYGQLTIKDIKAKYAAGEGVTTRDLIALKNEGELDGVMTYGKGAVRATGDINSTKDWRILTRKLDALKKKDNKSLFEEGYMHRMNNFMVDAKQPGAYQNFIAGTPEGARIWQEHNQTQAAINASTPFGDEAQVATQKHMQNVDNLNNLISKSNAVGIGMNYPDNLRQPIPLQYLTPIVNAFEKGGDPNGAIANLSMLSNENRVYAMNAFPEDYRKQLTVYQISNLAKNGDPRFLSDLMRSQQNNALEGGEKGISASEKYLQLDTSKEGYSDKKLAARIAPALASVAPWLRSQPNGAQVESAQVDQAMRYVKYVAAAAGDYKMQNINTYLDTYTKNMKEAYGVANGYNFILDKNNVPLEEPEMQVLSSHAINDVKQKLLEYRTPVQVQNMFSANPPMLVSSPGGRITVVDSGGNAIPDKKGEPAYSELYSESVWRAAERDTGNAVTFKPVSIASSFLSMPVAEFGSLRGDITVRGDSKIVRPVEQGNIDLDHREKVWGTGGDYSTVRTMTIGVDGKTVLLPTVIDGKIVSDDEAKTHYFKTGEHLGIFNNEKDANKYDQQMHKRMNWNGEGNKWEAPKDKEAPKAKEPKAEPAPEPKAEPVKQEVATKEAPKEAPKEAAKEQLNMPKEDRDNYLVLKHETSTQDPGYISDTKGDKGGASYGGYQLSSDKGTLEGYLDSKEGKPYAAELKKYKINSPEFRKAWKEMSKKDRVNFDESHYKYLKRTHYDPAFKKAESAGVDVSSTPVRQLLVSMSNQTSAAGIGKIIANASIKEGDSVVNQIKKLTASRVAYFKTLDETPKIKQSIINRAVRDELEAISSFKKRSKK
jgi:hypothetical protein